MQGQDCFGSTSFGAKKDPFKQLSSHIQPGDMCAADAFKMLFVHAYIYNKMNELMNTWMNKSEH